MTLQDMIVALLDSGFSQHSLAEAVGVSQPTIFKASKGRELKYTTGKKIERLYRKNQRAIKSAA